MISHIPNELWDRIIDFLHNEPAALRSSSLTCRDWVAASQFHLFPSTVDLRGENTRTRRFEFVMKASPHLTRYIQSLKLDAASTPWVTLATVELPRVTELLLDGLSCKLPSTTLACTRWLTRLPALRTLILFRVTFTRSAFLDVISTLPLLHRLDVVNADVEHWDEERHTPPHQFTSALQELHLSGFGTAEILGTLAELCANAGIQLTELHSGSCETAADLLALNEIMRLNPSLRHLEVYLLYSAEDAGPLDLSRNMALEGLVVELEMVSASVDALMGVAESLEQIAFPHLQNIHIVLNLFSSRSDIWTAKWWKMLGDVLKDPCFDKLEVLDITFHGHKPPEVVPEEDLSTLATKQLDFLSKRGVEISLESDGT
ncbi:hypothetical protein PUNSTDRAFT_145663 [Punctularia strigosozonata HHB-11173 SS5]|uniref:uncharacterized protein n=1 Tax=Punctularia strigosozonata (strain HHB-11173) TaxID=741275 RepID=UPI0004417D91|nr:uncharacterized protein PUNSTDRAFT_145663 [Punctularia strigosozonata HHB-11173 SS5]EIN05715.1 hypothetical protein PUNSTDRAFT_145663 [Punctularia strigosozonata HHB-11173 SS5]